MDMMEIRRKLLTGEDYIRNGLVLWMDGIDKGNVVDAWVDKINGHIFTNVNGMIIGNKYIQLDKNQMQYLQNDTFVAPLASQGTIEVVIEGYGNGQIVFLPKRYQEEEYIAFGFRPNNDEINWTTAQNYDTVPFTNADKSFSINIDSAFINMKLIQFTGSRNCWLNTNSSYSYIGRRNSGSLSNNFFDGKIYSIRIYDRKLSKEERLYNQYIDNKRFNLGFIA